MARVVFSNLMSIKITEKKKKSFFLRWELNLNLLYCVPLCRRFFFFSVLMYTLTSKMTQINKTSMLNCLAGSAFFFFCLFQDIKKYRIQRSLFKRSLQVCTQIYTVNFIELNNFKIPVCVNNECNVMFR